MWWSRLWFAGLLGGIYGLVPALGQPVFEITASLTYLLFAGAIARHYLRTTATIRTGLGG
jgi:hypothetical protein